MRRACRRGAGEKDMEMKMEMEMDATLGWA
jgi:hypothetical protein